jgi:hypothetical protein
MSTDTHIRGAIANTTRGEAARLTLPARVRDLDLDLDLDALDDVVDWRDPKAPARRVLLVPGPEEVVGISLRAGERAVRAAAMCALCLTTHAPGRVELFVARRPGAAGRGGDTSAPTCAGPRLRGARPCRAAHRGAASRLGHDRRRAPLRPA